MKFVLWVNIMNSHICAAELRPAEHFFASIGSRVHTQIELSAESNRGVKPLFEMFYSKYR